MQLPLLATTLLLATAVLPTYGMDRPNFPRQGTLAQLEKGHVSHKRALFQQQRQKTVIIKPDPERLAHLRAMFARMKANNAASTPEEQEHAQALQANVTGMYQEAWRVSAADLANAQPVNVDAAAARAVDAFERNVVRLAKQKSRILAPKILANTMTDADVVDAMAVDEVLANAGNNVKRLVAFWEAQGLIKSQDPKLTAVKRIALTKPTVPLTPGNPFTQSAGAQSPNVRVDRTVLLVSSDGLNIEKEESVQVVRNYAQGRDPSPRSQTTSSPSGSRSASPSGGRSGSQSDSPSSSPSGSPSTSPTRQRANTDFSFPGNNRAGASVQSPFSSQHGMNPTITNINAIPAHHNPTILTFSNPTPPQGTFVVHEHISAGPPPEVSLAEQQPAIPISRGQRDRRRLASIFNASTLSHPQNPAQPNPAHTSTTTTTTTTNTIPPSSLRSSGGSSNPPSPRNSGSQLRSSQSFQQPAVGTTTAAKYGKLAVELGQEGLAKKISTDILVPFEFSGPLGVGDKWTFETKSFFKDQQPWVTREGSSLQRKYFVIDAANRLFKRYKAYKVNFEPPQSMLARMGMKANNVLDWSVNSDLGFTASKARTASGLQPAPVKPMNQYSHEVKRVAGILGYACYPLEFASQNEIGIFFHVAVSIVPRDELPDLLQLWDTIRAHLKDNQEPGNFGLPGLENPCPNSRRYYVQQ